MCLLILRYEELIDVSVPKPSTLQIHVKGQPEYWIVYTSRVGSLYPIHNLYLPITIILWLLINITLHIFLNHS